MNKNCVNVEQSSFSGVVFTIGLSCFCNVFFALVISEMLKF